MRRGRSVTCPALTCHQERSLTLVTGASTLASFLGGSQELCMHGHVHEQMNRSRLLASAIRPGKESARAPGGDIPRYPKAPESHSCTLT